MFPICVCTVEQLNASCSWNDFLSCLNLSSSLLLFKLLCYHKCGSEYETWQAVSISYLRYLNLLIPDLVVGRFSVSSDTWSENSLNLYTEQLCSGQEAPERLAQGSQREGGVAAEVELRLLPLHSQQQPQPELS